ncbi:MAG: AlpA family phage regulatory protein [Xanthobacteraceae bacterium]
MSRAVANVDAMQMMRPPAFLSCASLARELDISESTVHELVRRGVLPKPIKLSSGCVRWRWAEVEAALISLGSGGSLAETANDPFLTGVRNVTTAA